MADFKIAYEITRVIEKGRGTLKHDNGGYTYNGITQKNWPDWEGWTFLATRGTLTENEQKIIDDMEFKFYQANFWDRIGLSSINNQKIANELYDTGVNAHPRKAIRFLQTALNLLNRNGILYPDIPVDEILGTKTLALTNNHPYPDALLKLLNGLQLSYYIAICEKDPSQEEFLRGWLKRVL